VIREGEIAPGPVVGEILQELLELVTDNPELNRRETLLDALREHLMKRREEKRGENKSRKPA
jgi:DNA polymerase sigma